MYLLALIYSVKYNKTLEALPLCLYESTYNIIIALGESRMTNIALGFASCYLCHWTLNSSCICIQTGQSAFKYNLTVSIITEIQPVIMYVITDVITYVTT